MVVNVLRSAANVQNYPDTGIYCYTAHEKMRLLLRWYAVIYVATLIDVLYKTSKKRAVIGS